MLTEGDKPGRDPVTRSGGAPERPAASPADRALGRGPDKLRVLAEHPGGVARRQRLPALAAAGQLGVVDQQVQRAGGEVEPDPVAVAHEGDRPAVGRLGGDVADAQARRPPGEAAVGEQQDVLAQARRP